MRAPSPRCSAALLSRGLIVALAVAATFLTPRAASAAAMLCMSNGCELVSGGCESWNSNSGVTCFSVGPIANMHLFRDGLGGASLLRDGKSIPVASDAVALLAANWAERGKKGNPDARATEAFRSAYVAAVRSDSRKVSDQRLAQIARELKLPVESRTKR